MLRCVEQREAIPFISRLRNLNIFLLTCNNHIAFQQPELSKNKRRRFQLKKKQQQMITAQYTEGKSSDEWGAIVDSSIQTENG